MNGQKAKPINIFMTQTKYKINITNNETRNGATYKIIFAGCGAMSITLITNENYY